MDIVWSRQFGQARVAVICEGTGWWPVERALEDVPEELWRPWVETDGENRVRNDFNLVHVTLPGASILLDTGFGEYDPTDPRTPVVRAENIRLTAGLDAGLASLGVRREDITHVLITHMHGDHVAGAIRTVDGRRVPAFPRARYYVAEAEWRSAPEWHQFAPAIAPPKDVLLAAGVVELVHGEREIVAGVRFIPAPGESPGFAIVRVATGDGLVYYVGELFRNAGEFMHPDWVPRYRDRETLIATRRRWLPQFAAEKAWLIMSHYKFPAIGQVEATDAGYRWIPLGARR